MDAVYGTGGTTFPKENPVESRKELINQKERQLENGSDYGNDKSVITHTILPPLSLPFRGGGIMIKRKVVRKWTFQQGVF